MKKLLFLLIAAASAAYGQWEPCMPDIIGHPVTALHFNGAGLYVATESGVSRSTDGGLTWSWSQLQLGASALNIAEIDGKLFVGTRYGLFISSNYGLEWSKAIVGDSLNWAFDVAKVSGRLLAATMKGVYSSTDGGASWGEKLFDLTMSTYCQLTSIGDKALITSRNDGNFYSDDGGNSWTRVADSLPFSSVAEFEGKMYGLTYNGIYVSTNAGLSFSMLDTLQDGNYTGIAANSNKIITCNSSGVRVYDILDGSRYWTKIDNEKIWKVGISGGVFYAGAERDLYQSTDQGKTWRCAKPGISSRFTNVLCQNGGSTLLGNDLGVYRSDNDGRAWSKENPNMPSNVVYRLAAFGDRIVATIGEATDSVIVTEDGGKTWKTGMEIFANGNEQSINCLAIDDKNIYLGGERSLIISTDGGQTWNSSPQLQGYEFYSIAVKGDSVWAKGLAADVFLSTDRGSSWTPQVGKLPFAKSYEIESAPDKVAFLTRDTLYVYRDGDADWIKKPLPARAIYKFDMKGDTIFVSSYEGPLLSIDNGNSWFEVGRGYFDNTINDLAISDKYVYIANSNGVFRAKISDFDITGAEEPATSHEEISVYPNPAEDILNLSIETGNALDSRPIRIYDLLGNIALELPTENAQARRINISGLKPGFYWISSGEKGKAFIKL